MNKNSRMVLSVILVLYFFLFGVQRSYGESKPYVVVISLDGFRSDYPETVHLPTFDSLARVGVKAEFLKSAFPSSTFPNHYTIATGLYPDHHGIVANNFYDPKLNRHFSVIDPVAVRDPAFYGGEPVWLTAEKQGIKTASFFWVGSETPINGNYPTYWKKYDQKTSFSARVDTLLHWLSLPEDKRPHLVFFYYHEPDASGHKYGPESKEMKDCLIDLDHKMADLTKKLKELPIFSNIDIIVLSDHGMASTSPDRSMNLSAFVTLSWFSHIKGSSPVLLFKVKPEYNEKAFQALKKIPHCRVWKSRKMPPELHYGKNPRTLDIVLLADNGWSIKLREDDPLQAGSHGYDPDNSNMHAIFYASGPSFKKGYTAKWLNTVDIYPLITRLLHINPEKVDGTIKQGIDMLKQ